MLIPSPHGVDFPGEQKTHPKRAISQIWPMGPKSPSWGRFFGGSNFGHSPTAFTCTTYRHVRLDVYMSVSAMTIFSLAQLCDSYLLGACVTIGSVRSRGRPPDPPRLGFLGGIRGVSRTTLWQDSSEVATATLVGRSPYLLYLELRGARELDHRQGV